MVFPCMLIIITNLFFVLSHISSPVVLQLWFDDLIDLRLSQSSGQDLYVRIDASSDIGECLKYVLSF